MLIRFKRDFQSQYTKGVFYRKGDTVDLEDGAALLAADPDAAEAVPLKAREGQVEPSTPEPKKPGRPAKEK